MNPIASPNLSKSTADVFSLKRHPLEFIQHRVSIVASDLLSQVYDDIILPIVGLLFIDGECCLLSRMDCFQSFVFVVFRKLQAENRLHYCSPNFFFYM